jgi:hypothetical protein
MDDPMRPGELLESDFSNVGGCFDFAPGKPRAPEVR